MNMEELVTISLNGIQMTVPLKELSLYTRAGYKRVEEPAEEQPVEDAPAQDEEPAKKPGRGKKAEE